MNADDARRLVKEAEMAMIEEGIRQAKEALRVADDRARHRPEAIARLVSLVQEAVTNAARKGETSCTFEVWKGFESDVAAVLIKHGFSVVFNGYTEQQGPVIWVSWR